MNRIVNLRGTSGAGKTETVRRLMKQQRAVPTEHDKRGRPVDYVMKLDNGVKVFVLGRYDSVCGGCDTFKDGAKEIMLRIGRYHSRGHVLFEGLLISGYWGSFGEWAQQFGKHFVLAQLTTPLDVCLERVQKRRLARGDTKPFNPKNTVDRWHVSRRVFERQLAAGINRCVEVNYRRPVTDLRDIIQRGYV